MYEIQNKVNALSEKIDDLRNEIKKQLTKKQIAFAPDDSLRKLIRLIPARTLNPINLYQSLSGHTAVNISDSDIMFCGGSNKIQKLYSTNNNIFVSKLNYPNIVSEHGGAKWRDIIYYCGGLNSTNKNYAYNIQSNTFTTKADIPENKAYHTFVATERNLLISGGYYSADLNTQYTYNVSSNAYSSKRTMPQPSDHHATTHIKNDQVLINGGNDSNNSTLNYIFDINTNSITQKRNLNASRSSHASLKINNNLILLNGGTASNTNAVQAFDVNANTFTNKRSSPTDWSNHTLSKVNLDFLISGGGRNRQFVYNYQNDTYVRS